MCDKKNSVLFTKTECLVLSPDFKLLDASQVLLRVQLVLLGSVSTKVSIASTKLPCYYPEYPEPLGILMGRLRRVFSGGTMVNSQSFQTYFNSQTRKVERDLHVNFLENKPNVAGQGPNWIFDIDSLTNSMNYQPVTIRNQTNKNAGPQEANGNTGLKQSVDVGQSEEKNVSTQQYVVFPLWSSISSSYKSSNENDTADDSAGESPVQKPASENEQALKNILDKTMDQEKEATK
ncbi:hypothetical protein Tco_0375684 [Tanacetum coccineum]